MRAGALPARARKVRGRAPSRASPSTAPTECKGPKSRREGHTPRRPRDFVGGRNAANSRIRRRVSVEGPRTPLAAQRNGEFPQTHQLAEIRQHAETRQKLANSKATFNGAGGFAIFAARVFSHTPGGLRLSPQHLPNGGGTRRGNAGKTRPSLASNSPPRVDNIRHLIRTSSKTELLSPGKTIRPVEDARYETPPPSRGGNIRPLTRNRPPSVII